MIYARGILKISPHTRIPSLAPSDEGAVFCKKIEGVKTETIFLTRDIYYIIYARRLFRIKPQKIGKNKKSPICHCEPSKGRAWQSHRLTVTKIKKVEKIKKNLKNLEKTLDFILT